MVGEPNYSNKVLPIVAYGTLMSPEVLSNRFRGLDLKVSYIDIILENCVRFGKPAGIIPLVKEDDSLGITNKGVLKKVDDYDRYGRAANRLLRRIEGLTEDDKNQLKNLGYDLDPKARLALLYGSAQRL